VLRFHRYYAERRYAESRYTERRYAECRSAHTTQIEMILFVVYCPEKPRQVGWHNHGVIPLTVWPTNIVNGNIA